MLHVRGNYFHSTFAKLIVIYSFQKIFENLEIKYCLLSLRLLLNSLRLYLYYKKNYI
jgi:hypothetical protein